MRLGVGTILNAYVEHALMTPSAIMRADFPDVRFRPSIEGGDGIQGPGVPPDGSWAFVDDGDQLVGGLAIDGTGRPVYARATGAVAVRVTIRQGVDARNRALRYADATRTALGSSSAYTSFASARHGRTLSLNHFQLEGDSVVRRFPGGANAPDYYLAVTRYSATARPTD